MSNKDAEIAALRRSEEACEREIARLRDEVRVWRKMYRYIAFVLTGDDDGDAQLGADRAKARIAALEDALHRITDRVYDPGDNASAEEMSEFWGGLVDKYQRIAQEALSPAAAPEEPAPCATCGGDGLVVSGFDDDWDVYENTEAPCPACRPAPASYDWKALARSDSPADIARAIDAVSAVRGVRPEVAERIVHNFRDSKAPAQGRGEAFAHVIETLRMHHFNTEADVIEEHLAAAVAQEREWATELADAVIECYEEGVSNDWKSVYKDALAIRARGGER